MEGGSFFQRLKQGLSKSRESLYQNIGSIFQNRRWNEASLDAMEESLIGADVGVKASQKLMAALRQLWPVNEVDAEQDMGSYLQTALVQMLQVSVPGQKITPFSARPWVILFLGVNGVGKTTTIGKLAAQYQSAGKKVLLVAGDTFRAAAIEQLDIWGQRIGVDVIKHRDGSDPSAVIFDAIQAARARKADFVIADTAGRLHTRSNLMEELKKINRVASRMETAGSVRNYKVGLSRA